MKTFFYSLFFVSACMFMSCSVANDNEGTEEESGQPSEVIDLTTIEQLAEYASKDNVEVRLSPGVYQIDDKSFSQELTLKKASGDSFVDYQVAALLHFSGNNSIYHLDGVEIEIDGKMHREFGKRHLFEIFVSGDNNVINGLSVRDMDDVVPSYGAIMMHITGDYNHLSGIDLFIRGSSPYGYGHLLGKGGGSLVKLYKHSSLLVTGNGTVLDACHVETHAFGHGIVMQGAQNTHIKNCIVEGAMRSTDEMLAETSGPAYDLGFKSDYPPGVIVPGEMKALSEDGVRAYASGYKGTSTSNIIVENTVVKNMRSGFCLAEMRGSVKVSGCTAIGCQEKGFSVPTNGVIENCKGDAQYGPVLSLISNKIKNCKVDLELMPESSDFAPKRCAEINGFGHKITIRTQNGALPKKVLPIVFGASFWADVHQFREPDKDMSNWAGATNVQLVDCSGIPVILNEYSQNCVVVTDGEVSDDGEGNRIEPYESVL